MSNGQPMIVVVARAKEDIYGTVVPSELDVQLHDLEFLDDTVRLFEKDDIIHFVLDKDAGELYTYSTGKNAYMLEDIGIENGKFNDEYADENFELLNVLEGGNLSSIDPTKAKELVEIYTNLWSFQIGK